MSKFKVGDTLKCIDGQTIYKVITIGAYRYFVSYINGEITIDKDCENFYELYIEPPKIGDKWRNTNNKRIYTIMAQDDDMYWMKPDRYMAYPHTSSKLLNSIHWERV